MYLISFLVFSQVVFKYIIVEKDDFCIWFWITWEFQTNIRNQQKLDYTF
jgi:hypothetical protein